ncbi:MAG: hypothetical protein NTW14_13675 [bacterium]|nr:hypothetical protein [bacterium]
MLKIVNWMTVVVLSLGMIPCIVAAQPTISGNLSGNLGPGTYIVVGNCTVPTGQSLIIAPGTTLLFGGHYFFYVNGQLTAVGTEVDSIKFLPQDGTTATRHGGLRFQPGTPTNNVLSYCRIDNARNQSFPIYTGGAIFVQSATLTVSHSRITNSISNTGGGLYANAATVIITACDFVADSAVDGAGIYANSCPITVTESGFYNTKCFGSGNGGGIFLVNCDQSQVRNSIFIGNHSDGT